MSELNVDQINPRSPGLPVNFTGPSIPTYNGVPINATGGDAAGILAGQLAAADGVTLVGNAADKRDLASTAVGKGSKLIAFIQRITGAVASTIEDKLGESISVFDFMTAAQRADVRSYAATIDLTAVIQTAIDWCATSAAVKELRFPAGRYRVDGQIVVKFGVSLVGADVPRRGQPGNWIVGGAAGVTQSGTDFVTVAGQGSTAYSAAFILMRPSSKVKNLNIWYSGQTTTDSSASIVVYAPTISVPTTVDGNSDNCVIENVSALNCYEFLRIGDGTNSVGRTVVTDCFANPFGPVGIKCRTMNGDLAVFTRVFIENLFTTDSVNRPNLFAYQRQTLVAFDLGFSQGVNMTDCIALGCKSGISVTSQTWAQVNNCLFDYCLRPLDASGGCDRVFFNNCSFIKNTGSGHALEIGGAVNHLSFTNCMIGDSYSGQKTGAFCYHTSGTVKFSGCTFTMSYPAVLNCGAGAVQLSACGIGYDRVTGANISVDGGPVISPGALLSLTNINPTSPAQTGWTYSVPASVSAITNGVRIAGTTSITYRPGDVSAANSNLMFFGTGHLCMEFDYKVTNQAGSPKMEILLLNDSSVVAVDAFQLSQDISTNDSGLPEGVTFHVTLLLPWQGPAGNTTRLRFNFPSQTSAVHEITNLKVSQLAVPRGFTGLEFYAGKTKLPLGYFDPSTGGRVWRFPSAPTAGTWSAGDKTINLTPTVGQPKGWTYTVAGAWASEGNL